MSACLLSHVPGWPAPTARDQALPNKLTHAAGAFFTGRPCARSCEYLYHLGRPSSVPRNVINHIPKLVRWETRCNCFQKGCQHQFGCRRGATATWEDGLESPQEKVAHLSASRNCQTSPHQLASSRRGNCVLWPSSQRWSCPTCSQNLAKSRSSGAAACWRPFAAATITECAQAARSHAFLRQVQKQFASWSFSHSCARGLRKRERTRSGETVRPVVRWPPEGLGRRTIMCAQHKGLTNDASKAMNRSMNRKCTS